MSILTKMLACCSMSLLLVSCATHSLTGTTARPETSSRSDLNQDVSQDFLQQSWQVYRQRFIQADGRVIDREAEDRSTSEGQAYALLRAVWIDDRDTFDRVLQWSDTNLQRRGTDGQPIDRLWAWKWGKQANGSWGPIDANFASDGDIDGITALIFAAKRWNRPQYLDLARNKLADLWQASVLVQGSDHYLLPGPKEAFYPRAEQAYLNPSYFAPYAFRLFAMVDRKHDWLSLVESSYRILETSAQLSTIGLPSDWVLLNPTTGAVAVAASGNLQSRYGFDAYRVWWRVGLDAIWFREPRAQKYLKRLQPLEQQWRSTDKILAQIDLQGKPIVDYESTAQYAMIYAALRFSDSKLATAIYQKKLLPSYQNGFWDNDSAYYTQNLSWLGLFPIEQLPADWFRS